MYFRNVFSYTGSGFQTLSGSHPNIGRVPRWAPGWDGGIPHNRDGAAEFVLSHLGVEIAD